MAIPISCPSCEREFKVKDELAGRKIKCPGCGNVIAVLRKTADTKARITASKARTVPAADEEDEEPEEEERPRKKKKKKAANNRVLIGAAIGGVVLIVVVVLIVMLIGGGNAKEKVAQKRPDTPKADPQPVNSEPAPNDGPDIKKKAAVGGIARSRERTEIENTLRQLGIAFRNFEVEQNRGPKNQKELGPYYENVGPINEALTNKWITFIWGANRDSFADMSSNTILAYETDADRQGFRFTLMGDGSVQSLNEEEFKNKPKAKGK